jgi:hypothetical protein
MTAGLVTLGYDALQLSDLIDRDLKGSSVGEQEKIYLQTHPSIWKAELIRYKKRTEMQFTSSKARSFTLYKEYCTQQLSHAEYLAKLNDEKVWRCNAARFLQQVELKLQEIKALDGSISTQT